jgi:hypothetical protein
MTGVNRFWRRRASQGALWKKMCDQMWAGKVFIPATAKELLAPDDRRPIEAYRVAMKDAQRTAITLDELCSFTWYAHDQHSALHARACSKLPNTNLLTCTHAPRGGGGGGGSLPSTQQFVQLQPFCHNLLSVDSRTRVLCLRLVCFSNECHD